MDWLSENWGWMLFALLFIVMYLAYTRASPRTTRARDEKDGTAPREADEAGPPVGHRR